MLRTLLTIFFLDMVHSFSPSGIKMLSPSEIYLRSLSLRQPQITATSLSNILNKNDVNYQLKNAQQCTKTDVEVDTILFNIFKVQTVFLNRNCRTIYFKLKEDMKDLYFYDEDLQKITKNTTIIGKGFTNFMFVPMNFDTPVDAIMYTDKSI